MSAPRSSMARVGGTSGGRAGRGEGARRGAGRARRAFGVAVAGTALLVSGCTVSGCTTARNVLGPKVSPCYRAVAVARLALHRHGRFDGVRALPGTSVELVLADYHPRTSRRVAVGPRTAICLVAYRGRFSAAGLQAVLRPGPAEARVAVVVVRQKDLEVVGILLVNRAPRRLARVLPTR